MEQLSLELLDSRDLVAGQRTQCSSPFKHMGCFGILHRAAWVHSVLAMSPHTEVEGAGMVPLFLISVLPEQLSWQTSHRGAPLHIDLDLRPCRLLPDGANSGKIAGITATAEYR